MGSWYLFWYFWGSGVGPDGWNRDKYIGNWYCVRKARAGAWKEWEQADTILLVWRKEK